jgi:class 3 adenylate cyclase
MSKAFTPESFLENVRAPRSDDVSELIHEIACPTLVIQPQAAQIIVSPEAAREIAAGVKGARFRTSSLTKVLSLLVEIDDARAFAEFFEEAPAGELAELPSGTAIILFADIVDSTALTESLGDTAFREKAHALDQAMRSAIRDNGGTAVEGKTLGDGVLAVFTSAKQAIMCAQACHDAASAVGLALHAGIHAGDIIREADNVYGGAVNIAARIAAASAAGETLVSDTVRSLARTSAGVTFSDRGEQSLKGIGDSVRLFEVSGYQR